MAVGALRRELDAESLGVEVASAGIAAREDQPASEDAVRVAARDGVDLRGHRSRLATAGMLRAADLILVMEREHARAARALGADAQRVHVLSEWPEPGEPLLALSDPFGGSIEAYEECWRRIRHHVRRIVPHVREALRARS